MGEVLTFSINYGTGVRMDVFYEIDIVAHNRSPDFFYMECKHGSRTLNLLFRSTSTCRVEVSFPDRIVRKV